MRFAICDDEPEHIKLLQAYFDKRPELFIESEPYYSGEALVADYQNNGVRYDALFIDMEMGAMNGIDTANAIRALDEYVIIIFVTSYAQYAPLGFECGASRYLVKPLRDKKVNEALDFIVKRLSREKKILSFNFNKEHVRLLCDDIIYCESEHNGSIIYTQDGSFPTRMTISELITKLDNEQFSRVNRGYIVNLARVKISNSERVVMQGCQSFIPIGKTYRRAFERAMIRFEERMYYG